MTRSIKGGDCWGKNKCFHFRKNPLTCQPIYGCHPTCAEAKLHDRLQNLRHLHTTMPSYLLLSQRKGTRHISVLPTGCHSWRGECSFEEIRGLQPSGVNIFSLSRSLDDCGSILPSLLFA
ncbi:hypothetical protein I7I50_05320 [Histoplasma capsulatum G186AR]|uniref:Uncharacterized protein n=1 Tax=Ajellomyces capsulatus TaxID=5037 RepID=A0A8H7Z970_AJECA|nr:hypothetical protein I7I52_03581 [Histoplasma capsulatum]QSS76005.1 hypothetical protein I7I50_05320 [Histoplasma capsulatum G186AR]